MRPSMSLLYRVIRDRRSGERSGPDGLTGRAREMGHCKIKFVDLERVTGE